MADRLIQPSFAGGEVSPNLFGRVDLAKYQIAMARMSNFYADFRGGAVTRPGFEYCNTRPNIAAVRLIPFQFNTQQTYVLEFGDQYMRVIMDGGYVLDGGGNPYTLATPYIAEHLSQLKYSQSNDTMTLTHMFYSTRDLTRSGHAAWSLDVVAFAATIAAPASCTAAMASIQYINEEGILTSGSLGPATEYIYTVTAVSAADGTESLASPLGAVQTGSFSLNTLSIRVTWPAVSGAEYYNVYRSRWATGTTYTEVYSTAKPPVDFGRIGSTSLIEFVDSNITADYSTTAPLNENPFALDSTYPSTSAYFQQRKFFAASYNKPQTIWATQVGAYKNMNKSRPVRATDAIEATLSSQQVNAIRHLIPLSDGIVALTDSSFWQITGGENGISPSALMAKQQGLTGASHVPPLVIGNDILFIQSSGNVVRDLAFSFFSNGFSTTDLTVFANHLFLGYTIVDWTYAEDPNKIIWAVRDDGKLLSCTFLKEQEVTAWAQHETDGEFKAICSIIEDGVSAVYAVVERQVNGYSVQYIERMRSREWITVTDTWAVDSALRYEGAAAQTISGLEHLEGRTVAILGDGNVHPSQVVVDGEVTLDAPCTNVTIGLPYTCQLQTLPLEAGEPTVQGKRKRVTAVTMRTYKTRGLKAGPSFDRLTEVKERSNQDYGDPIELISDDQRVIIERKTSRYGQVCIEQSNPLPATVLALIPEVDFAGD